MSCYLRHLKEDLNEAGIEVTAGNKKQIDQTIHQFAGITYKDCPQTWKKLKQDVMGDQKKRQALIQKLKIATR